MDRRRLTNIVIGLVFVTGLAVLLYPLVADLWNSWREEQLISSYDATTAVEAASDDALVAGKTVDEWVDLATAYNATLKGKGIPDAFAIHSAQESSEYLGQLAYRDDDMMGYIQIPKIGQSLPIYHGTSDAVLAKGVGHLQGSALPVGGASTHCVLSAHRGLPSASLFTDLDKLETGDHFYLHVLDRVLAYEVDQVQVVEPDQTQSLDVTEGEDLVTLVTCTPYGVNTQRLLVRGRRVVYDADVAGAEVAAGPTWSIFTQYWVWVLAGLLLVALFVMTLLRGEKRREQNRVRAARHMARPAGGRRGHE